MANKSVTFSNRQVDEQELQKMRVRIKAVFTASTISTTTPA
jgi:hypothetical protein